MGLVAGSFGCAQDRLFGCGWRKSAPTFAQDDRVWVERSRFLAALGMTERKASAKATAKARATAKVVAVSP